ncbi:MAG: RNA polymerase sigma factor [Chloroflexi bacterium]|nr:RNA polymerase sigma factor [Chloroflexota bacterium]
MTTQPDQIESNLEQILTTVAARRGVPFAANLRPILLANLERGRIDFYLNNHAQAQLHEYVWRVADYYVRLSPYLRTLQQTKSPDVWEPLLQTLRQWASTLLRHTPGLAGDPDQLSPEYAAAAAEKLLTAYFPYDTEFDPWAYVLVRNVCRQLLRRERPPIDPIDDDQVAQLPDLRHADVERARDLRRELLGVIEQLSSDARRQLIVLHYFQGYSLPDIAARLGKTMSAIYKLHFDALAELRKIWAGKEHIDE